MGGIISGKIVGAAQITGRVCASSISAGDYTITIDPIEGGYRLRVERGGEVQTMELLDGKPGADGQASYVHIKYSSVPNPTGSDEMSDAPQDYIGIYTDNAQEDSGDPADYTWARIKGEPGLKGDPGEPGQDAPQEAVLYTPQTLTADQQEQARSNVGAASAERVEAVENALPGKLSEPTEGLAVGKYFRVAAIDENGHAVLEAVDAKDVGVQDVQVAGASVVEDGVANVPIANDNNLGLVKVYKSGYYGLNFSSDGYLALQSAADSQITNRIEGRMALRPANIDLIVKAAMCDGKGAAWTADEQAAARERLGASSPYRHIASIEIEESGVTCIGIETDENGAAFELKNVVIYGFLSKLSASAGVAVAINSVKTTLNGANNIAKVSSLGLGSNGAAVEININRYKYWRSSIIYSTGVPDGYITQSTGYTVVSHRGASGVRANEWEYLTALSICVDNTDGFGIGTKFDIWGR